VHAAWQTPATQLLPAPQGLPQAPQLAGSIRVSTQTPVQLVRPVAQTSWQAPAAQVYPEPQAWPQDPQLARSVWRLVQTSAGVPAWQVVLGARHWQVPVEQVVAGTQTFPQAPQLAPLEPLSTQVPVTASFGQSPTVDGVVLQTQAPAAQVPSPQE
jgi:hypothetical protein